MVKPDSFAENTQRATALTALTCARDQYTFAGCTSALRPSQWLQMSYRGPVLVDFPPFILISSAFISRFTTCPSAFPSLCHPRVFPRPSHAKLFCDIPFCRYLSRCLHRLFFFYASLVHLLIEVPRLLLLSVVSVQMADESLARHCYPSTVEETRDFQGGTRLRQFNRESVLINGDNYAV